MTPDESKLPGYTGEIKYSYKIVPRELKNYMDYATYMKATLSNTSYAYTGNTITKIKASDIALVDRETGDDLSNYLNVDKDGFVEVVGTPKNVDDSNILWISLISGTPKKGNKNYSIKGSTVAGRRTYTDNNVTVVTREFIYSCCDNSNSRSTIMERKLKSNLLISFLRTNLQVKY